MEQLIGILIFYAIYTLFNLLQKKSGGAPKAPPGKQPARPGQTRQTPKPGQQPVPEQNRDHLPDFLRRWIEEAEKLEREPQQQMEREKQQIEPEPQPLEPAVSKHAERKAAAMAEGGYVEQSLHQLQLKRQKLIDDNAPKSQLDVLLNSGITISSGKKNFDLRKQLKNPENLRNVILLNEILKKPVFYRGPGIPLDR